jgi:hypothetical protein
VLAEPNKSRRGFSEVSHAGTLGRHVPEKADSVKSGKAALHIYRFQRTRTPGIIEVLNEHFYVMAVYSQRTGSVKWQRIVLASQREQVEKWLEDHYPRA